MVSLKNIAYWRIPFQNNAWLSARHIVLVQMTVPWSHTTLSYRNITLFRRDCYIYIYMCVCVKSSLSKRTETMPYSFTRTVVCFEGYFLKRMPHTCESYLRKTINIFRKYHIWNCVVLISCYIFPNECGSFFEGRMPNIIVQANTVHEIIKYFVKGMPHSWKNVYIQIISSRDATLIWNSTTSMENIQYLFQNIYICGRHGALFLY